MVIVLNLVKKQRTDWFDGLIVYVAIGIESKKIFIVPSNSPYIKEQAIKSGAIYIKTNPPYGKNLNMNIQGEFRIYEDRFDLIEEYRLNFKDFMYLRTAR